MYKGNLLAKIHIGKKELGLDDDDYRAFLFGFTNKHSAKDLTDNQKLLIVMEMKKRGAFKKKPLNGQQKACVAKWYKLRSLGEVRSKDKSSLNRYAKTNVGKWNIADMTPAETNKLLGMLEGWIQKIEHTAGKNTHSIIEGKNYGRRIQTRTL